MNRLAFPRTVRKLRAARHAVWYDVTAYVGLDPAVHGRGDRFVLARGRGLAHGWNHAMYRSHVVGLGANAPQAWRQG